MPPSGPGTRGDPLKVVGDEWGTPTYTADVADAIVELLGATPSPGSTTS